ncbi:MAG: FtsW/RodA/SpoVE family cell cycle protein [Acutalibacteraceae bacterium]
MTEILETLGNIFVFAARIVLPVLCFLLIFGVVKDLLKKRGKITLAKLVTANGLEFDINSVESIIGRSKICDVILNIPSISRRHAVITYSEDYGFKISSVYGTEIRVNDTVIDEYAYFDFGDVIEIGRLQLKLIPAEEIDIYSSSRPKKRGFSSAVILTLIQAIIFIELMIHYADSFKPYIPVSFGILFVMEWVYFLFYRFRDNINIEILGFFLTTIGFAVAASATPDNMLKQLITAVLGIVAFVVLQFLYKNMDWVMKLRYYAGAFAILLLGYNLIFGINLNGAKNWIKIGSFSFQPSELVKFLFIFTTAATLQNLLSKRNLILFLGFSAGCMGALVLMRDFGTCSIFFVTVLIILFMRSGDIKIISAITSVVAVGAVLVAKFVPYVQRRFATYRHAWEYASDKGYQQTRTMIAIASGALLGVGGGAGKLKYVIASDTDLVFGLVCEEWGMIVGFCAIACFVIFAVYSFKCAPFANSAYFVIAACSASGLWLFQISLNIFGSVDLLPLTGVTLPFISNGGSSMISSWLLLSFIKAIGKNTLKEPAYYDEEEQAL